MTRYEYFEAWLTTEEWKDWKKHSVTRFSLVHAVSLSTARAMRDRYLKEEVAYDENNADDMHNDWDYMTDQLIRWADTRQGHWHWQGVNSRDEAVRFIAPDRIVINTTTINRVN